MARDAGFRRLLLDTTEMMGDLPAPLHVTAINQTAFGLAPVVGADPTLMLLRK